MTNGAKNGRVYLRVNDALKKDMESYAQRHSTSLSALVTTFFENLLRKEEEDRIKAAKRKFL